jgi:Uma2 family endonuclease
MYQPIAPLSPKDTLPTMYDLPSEEVGQSGLPDEFHVLQPQLLSATFIPSSYPLEEIFTASDLNLYYDPRHLLWYKRPDWFAVVGVPSLYEGQELRQSYVLWQEGVDPLVVVEFLSPGTEDEDLGRLAEKTLGAKAQPPFKWEVYERILRVPYYVVFNSETNQIRAFELVGTRYREMELSEPRLWIEELGLGLGLWQGFWLKQKRPWLRWYDLEGNWVPTPEEREQQFAEQAVQQTEQAQQRAMQAEQRAEILAQRLRELGVNPDDL